MKKVFGRAGDMTAIRKNLTRDLRFEMRETKFQTARAVAETGARQGQRGSGFEARQAIGCFTGYARQQPRLLAQRHEHLRTPQHVGIAENKPAMREQMDQAARHDMGGRRGLGVTRIALEPLADEIGRERPRRVTASGGQRRQPGKTMQRFRPRNRRRRLVEDRALANVDGFTVEFESAMQQRLRVFQPPRQRVVGMKDDAVGQRPFEQAAIEPCPPPEDSRACKHPPPGRAQHLGQQRKRRRRPARHLSPATRRYWRRSFLRAPETPTCPRPGHRRRPRWPGARSRA